MGPRFRRDILRAFLIDAHRIYGKAQECYRELVRQSSHGVLDTGAVRQFYHQIHALKGTASMIEGGAPLVEALQAIEAELSCQPLSQSAQSPGWLERARLSLQKTEAALQNLKQKDQDLGATKSVLGAWHSAPEKGFLAKVERGGQENLFWFPLRALLGVLTAQELSGRTLLCVRGKWVPVFGAQDQSAGEMGLILSTEKGTAVIVAKEVLGIVTGSEALAASAKAVSDLFKSSGLTSDRVASAA